MKYVSTKIQSKKAVSFTMKLLIIFVILAITAFGIISIWTGGSAKAKTFLHGAIEAYAEDCDNDGVTNEHDECPTLNRNLNEKTGKLDGTPDERDNFLGCPKRSPPMTIADRNLDKATYNFYVKEKGAEPTKECKEEDKEKCITKCQLSFKETLKLEKKAGEEAALKGNFDLWISVMSVFENRDDEMAKFGGPGISEVSLGTFKKNLAGRESEATVYVTFIIWNLGTQDLVSEGFTAQFYSCSQINPKKCVPLDKFEITEDLPAGRTATRDKLPILVGAKGDYCDGKGKKKNCYVKLVLDPNNEKIGETDETNNEAFFLVSLLNQKWEPYEFNMRKTIHLRAQEDEEGTYPITQTCKGFIGESDLLGYCDPDDRCEDDFHQDWDNPAKNPLWKAEGCWVAISEIDGDGNDCGEVLAVPGFVLNTDKPRGIDWNKGADYHSDNKEADPRVLVAGDFKWHPTAEGSLLCSNNAFVKPERFTVGSWESYLLILPGPSDAKGEKNQLRNQWLLCDEEGEGGIAELKDKRKFACIAGKWEDRGK